MKENTGDGEKFRLLQIFETALPLPQNFLRMA